MIKSIRNTLRNLQMDEKESKKDQIYISIDMLDLNDVKMAANKDLVEQKWLNQDIIKNTTVSEISAENEGTQMFKVWMFTINCRNIQVHDLIKDLLKAIDAMQEYLTLMVVQQGMIINFELMDSFQYIDLKSFQVAEDDGHLISSFIFLNQVLNVESLNLINIYIENEAGREILRVIQINQDKQEIVIRPLDKLMDYKFILKVINSSIVQDKKKLTFRNLIENEADNIRIIKYFFSNFKSLLADILFERKVDCIFFTGSYFKNIQSYKMFQSNLIKQLEIEFPKIKFQINTLQSYHISHSLTVYAQNNIYSNTQESDLVYRNVINLYLVVDLDSESFLYSRIRTKTLEKYQSKVKIISIHDLLYQVVEDQQTAAELVQVILRFSADSICDDSPFHLQSRELDEVDFERRKTDAGRNRRVNRQVNFKYRQPDGEYRDIEARKFKARPNDDIVIGWMSKFNVGEFKDQINLGNMSKIEVLNLILKGYIKYILDLILNQLGSKDMSKVNIIQNKQVIPINENLAYQFKRNLILMSKKNISDDLQCIIEPKIIDKFVI